MNYSYTGIGEMAATFALDGTAEAGQAVKVSAAGTVAPCARDDRFAGVLISLRDGCAGVQLRGAAEFICSGALPAPGFAVLAADGDGGVYAAAAGHEYLVLDARDGRVTILL